MGGANMILLYPEKTQGHFTFLGFYMYRTGRLRSSRRRCFWCPLNRVIVLCNVTKTAEKKLNKEKSEYVFYQQSWYKVKQRMQLRKELCKPTKGKEPSGWVLDLQKMVSDGVRPTQGNEPSGFVRIQGYKYTGSIMNLNLPRPRNNLECK